MELVYDGDGGAEHEQVGRDVEDGLDDAVDLEGRALCAGRWDGPVAGERLAGGKEADLRADPGDRNGYGDIADDSLPW